MAFVDGQQEGNHLCGGSGLCRGAALEALLAGAGLGQGRSKCGRLGAGQALCGHQDRLQGGTTDGGDGSRCCLQNPIC